LLTIRTEDGLIKSVTLPSRQTQSSDTRQPIMS